MPVLQVLTRTGTLSKTGEIPGKLPAKTLDISGGNHFSTILARDVNIDENRLEFQKQNHKEYEQGMIGKTNPNASHPNIYLCGCAFAKVFRGSEIGIDLSGITEGIWKII